VVPKRIVQRILSPHFQKELDYELRREARGLCIDLCRVLGTCVQQDFSPKEGEEVLSARYTLLVEADYSGCTEEDDHEECDWALLWNVEVGKFSFNENTPFFNVGSSCGDGTADLYFDMAYTSKEDLEKFEVFLLQNTKVKSFHRDFPVVR